MSVLALVVYFLVFRSQEVKLVSLKPTEPNQFIGIVHEADGMTYRVRIDGKVYNLKADGSMNGSHEDEMAMPGSDYFPCKTQPIGAILVTTSDSDVRIFGVFWRMDNYLITARHCSNTLYQSTAKIYLATIRPTKRGNNEVDRSNLFKVDGSFFNPDSNAISQYDIDAFATELDDKVWSQIGVTKASTKVRSCYNQQVHSVGFTPDGLLVSASGKTLADSGCEVLYHTASTQKGFSGSILLCGSSVVGMHVSAAGEFNVAIRVELLQYLIDLSNGVESNNGKKRKYTYANASYKEYYRENKWRGGVAKVKQNRDGTYSVELQNGECTYGWSQTDLVDCFGPSGDRRKDYDILEDLIWSKSSGKQYIDHDDENASIVSSKSRKQARRAKKKQAEPAVYTKETGLKRVHGPSAPKVQPEAIQVIEDHKGDIVKLGYEEGKFQYPEMDPATESKSLRAHLSLFGERVRSVTNKPSRSEIERCSKLVAERLAAASYVPDADYDQVSGLMNVINSSIISVSKSAGYPYCTQGIPTNGQVLAQYGERGFAQEVINKWNDPYEFKLFLKGEPTKKSKLDRGMPRCIAGFPLHGTIKHASVFKNLAFSLVSNWKKTPVKYAFSPANPGHLEHLIEWLPGAIWESDKKNWDYMMNGWIVDNCCEVIKLLALKNPDWSDEQYAKYLSDIEGCFKQVFDNSVYRTSNGEAYTVNERGIMKSGWYMTIVVNSIAQIVVDTMIQIKAGTSDDTILATQLIAGGDDVNQQPAECGMDEYVKIAKTLGIEIELHERPSMVQSEYFSNDIRMGKAGPEFYPKRWTKHIEHLKTVKLDDLADALCSHMENYRHDLPKFNLLEKMYHELRDKHPASFPITKLCSRQYLLAKQYGYEHALC